MRNSRHRTSTASSDSAKAHGRDSRFHLERAIPHAPYGASAPVRDGLGRPIDSSVRNAPRMSSSARPARSMRAGASGQARICPGALPSAIDDGRARSRPRRRRSPRHGRRDAHTASVDTGGERPSGDRSTLSALGPGSATACGVRRTRWHRANAPRGRCPVLLRVRDRRNALRRTIVQTYEDLHRHRQVVMEREVQAVRS